MNLSLEKESDGALLYGRWCVLLIFVFYQFFYCWIGHAYG